VADSVLSSDGSIAAGQLAGDSLHVPTVQEQARSAQIAAMKSDAAAVANTGDYLHSLVTQAASTHYGQVALQNDTIAAAMRSKIAVPTATVLATGNKIGSAVVNSLKANLQQTALQVPAAGLSSDYPPWERQLYSELPPADALRIATYLRRETSLTDADRAAISQAATNPAMNVATGGGGIPVSPPIVYSIGTGVAGAPCSPTDYASFALDDSGNPSVTCPPKVPPAPPVPPVPPVPPSPPTYPVCTPYGACGICTDAVTGQLHALGMLPQIVYNGNPNQPDDATVLECRISGAQSIEWDGVKWNCVGTGTNYLCTDSSPPVPPVPASPPPDTCPIPTGPISIDLPSGWALLPPGQCNPMPGGGAGAGGGGPINLPPGSGGETVDVTVPVTVNVPPPATTPPAPPAPPGPPAPTATVPTYAYDDPATVCSQLAAGLSGSGGGSSSPGGGGGSGSVGTIANELLNAATATISWFTNAFTSNNNLYAQAQGDIYQTAQQAAGSINFNPNADGHCTVQATNSGSAVVYGLQHWAERITGTPFTYFSQWMQYSYQYSCPQYLLDQGSFDAMFNAGVLTDDQWECYTRSLGNLPNLHRTTRDLSRTRAGFTQLYMLFQRGDIDSDTYGTLVNELGVARTDDRQLLELSQLQNPNPSLLIDWMRLEQYASDDGQSDGRFDDFDEAYSQVYQNAAHAQGVTDSYMNSLWGAQWSLPSLGDAIEMSHRFRGQEGSDQTAVTDDDLQRIAAVQGIAPAWRDRMIALGDKLITRQQIQQAYNYDAIDRDGVTEKYLEVGYNTDDANTLTLLADAKKQAFIQQQLLKSSPWTPRSIVKAYVDGAVSQDTATNLLASLQVDEGDIGTLLSQAESARDAIQTTECIKGFRRQFLIGAITDRQAVASLLGAGVDFDVTQSLIAQWQCQMASRSKELGAEKNVQWFLKGILTIDALSTRLQNLGFLPDDVTGFIQEALITQQQQLAKAAATAAKQEAAAKKAAKAAAKQAQAEQRAQEAKVTGTKSRQKKTTEPDGSVETDTTTTTQPPQFIPAASLAGVDAP
jgi:hypothetical protein